MMQNQIVQTKVDSQEKLAAVAGQPTNKYLFAQEINTIVFYLRILWSLANFNGSTLIPSVKKELGTITGSFIDYINTHTATVWPSPAFVTYTIGGVEYVQAFVGYAGTYGTGQLQVFAEQFVLVHQSDETPVVTQKKVLRFWLSHPNIGEPVIEVLENNTAINLQITTGLTGQFLTNIPSVAIATIQKNGLVFKQGTNEPIEFFIYPNNQGTMDCMNRLQRIGSAAQVDLASNQKVLIQVEIY